MEQHKKEMIVAAIVIALGYGLVHWPLGALVDDYLRVLAGLHNTGFVGGAASGGTAAQQVEAFKSVIIPVKNMLFLTVVVFLGIPVGRATLGAWRKSMSGRGARAVGKPMVALLALGLLAFPMQLGLLGRGYSRISMSLMGATDPSGLLYRRALMPALAHFTQLQGPFWYLIFSLIVSYGLLVCINWYFSNAGLDLPLYALISVGTSAFFFALLQSPGYPEHLAYILVLLAAVVPMDDLTKVKAGALALLAHEGVMLVLAPLAIFRFTLAARRGTLLVIGAYLIAWLASHGWRPLQVIASHNINGLSGWQWAIREPALLVAGIFFTYKLLWILIVWALIRSPAPERSLIVSMLAVGFLACFLGVDTTRMAGFGFIGLLVALAAICRNRGKLPLTAKLVLAANLCVPSLYVGLNVGGYVFNGLYKLMFHGVVVSATSKIF